MRTAVVRKPGDSTAISLEDLPLPVPQAGEVRIRVAAAGVNPVDVMTRSGVFHQLGWIQHNPVGLGWDVAGYIDAVGPDVTGFHVGDAVAGLRDTLDAPSGTYADAVILPAAAIAIIPDGLGFAEAATVPLNALAADQALDLLELRPGQSLLVTGAAGAVGGYAVALAKARGLEVTAFARESDAAFLRRTGATHVVDSLSGLAGSFDGVLDAASLVQPALDAVRDGGRYVGVLPAAIPTSDRPIEIKAVMAHADGKRLAQLLELAREGALEPRIAGILPLAQAEEAHRKVERGGQRGRWVLAA